MTDICMVPDLSVLTDSFNDVCCLPIALAVAVVVLAVYRWRAGQ